MNPVVMFVLFAGPLYAIAWKTYCEALSQITDTPPASGGSIE